MGERRRFLKVTHVVAELHADLDLVRELAEAEIIHVECDKSGEDVLSEEDVDRVRLAQVLTEDLDVNLAGAEVILHMRETLVAMQRQLHEILEAVAHEVRKRDKR